MTDHASQGQSDFRALRAVVVLATVEMRIAQDGVAPDHIKRQRLAGHAGGSRQRDHPAHAFGIARRPGQRLVPAQRATHDCEQLLDPQVIQQSALHLHHVANGDGWEVAPVGLAGGRVEAAGTGGAAAAAQQIGADDKEAIGVNGLAGTDRDVPPAVIVLFIMRGHVRVAADGVADQHRVVVRGIQLAVGLVGHRDTSELPAEFQCYRLLELDALHVAQRPSAAHAVTALKCFLTHSELFLLVARGGKSEPKRPTRHFCDAFSAWSRSALMSSTSSRPMQRRT